MSAPFQVGDLVQIVRACKYCGDSSEVGWIFNILSFSAGEGPMECCGLGNEDDETVADVDDDDGGYPLYMLKRIPPLSELEGLESEEMDKVPTQRLIEAAKRYKRLVTSK